MHKLLVVDDEPDVVYSFRRLLRNEPIHVIAAQSGEEALEALPIERPDLVLMDVRMKGMDGLTALRAMRKIDSKLMVVVMTAFGTTQTAIEAMKLGAYDYTLKPFHVDAIKELIRAALKAGDDMKRVVSYQPLLSREEYSEGIIGKSAPMQEVYKRIGRVAAREAPVLITGESGTGKELVAKAIYHHSARSAKPFLAINCAAIPETLLESELFGYEKGAFTGAAARKLGKFEVCDGGVIFLDEIGDMPPATQAKILRVLQEGELERVGGSETIRVDVRVLAATNKDLAAMIQAGRFREDLFYRLNVVSIEMPPLRDRREDIPLLTEYFLQRFQPSGAEARVSISREAMDRLRHADWPGNVRQLENVIKNALVTCKGATILSSDLSLDIETPKGGPAPGQPAAPGTDQPSILSDRLETIFDDLMRRRAADPTTDAFDVVEKEMILLALRRTGGNQLQAAKLLGITRSTLRKRVAKYKISIETTIQMRGAGE
ncbi:MAG: sigma-54 dependent transcriptional regulator [Candidatus Sumerlaeota bacterium]|nr:sigma-54 dependent transcriptional regulator [Candidatus Sumerlaeota bacterium]